MVIKEYMICSNLLVPDPFYIWIYRGIKKDAKDSPLLRFLIICNYYLVKELYWGMPVVVLALTTASATGDFPKVDFSKITFIIASLLGVNPNSRPNLNRGITIK